jgi:hypothetical protein
VTNGRKVSGSDAPRPATLAHWVSTTASLQKLCHAPAIGVHWALYEASWAAPDPRRITGAAYSAAVAQWLSSAC